MEMAAIHDLRCTETPIRNVHMGVAFFSPAWRKMGVANGIASYVNNLVPALFAEKVSPIVLTWKVGDQCRDSFVRPLRATKESALGLPERMLRKISLERWMHRQTVRSIVQELDHLQCESAVELFEIEESFGWAYQIAHQVPIPVVVRLHGPWFLMGPLVGGDQENGFRRRVKHEGRGIESAAGISAPSMDVLERTRARYGLPLKEAVVIANPILPCPLKDRWQLPDCDRNLVLFVGRFDGHKGGDVMIDAFVEVARRNSSARLVFVGPDRGMVDSSGKQWTVQEYIKHRFGGSPGERQVEWLGAKSQDEIALLRRKAAVTVVCSRYENFPMAALEAMAAGSPLVVSNVGGLAEIVQHERNGLLCSPEDPGDLSDKILMLLEHPELGAKLGAQAMADAMSRYHPDIIAGLTIEFYREVLARWNSRERNR
jgi:glycosyltransferase involved in cell wall biosynthesis